MVFPILRKRALGGRIGRATSAAILVVSLGFFGYKYVSETDLLTDQLHAHMGENVAALTSGLGRLRTAEEVQAGLEQFMDSIRLHMHEFGHTHSGEHVIAVVDEDGVARASTERRWIGQSVPEELVRLAQTETHTSDERFRIVGIEGTRYLFLAEPLGSGGSAIYYLEPYASVARLARGSLLRNLGFSLLLSVILAIAVNLLVNRLVTRRLELLAEAMARVEREGLGVELPRLGDDELGAVRDVYAHTLLELKRSREEIEEHARTLETKVAERTAQLVRAHRLAAVGELAAGVAHGLNNPLASVAASAEKLLDLIERDRQQLEVRLPDHLQRILRNTDRCKHITQSLLSFARESTFSPRLISIAPVLSSARAVVEPEAESRGIELRLEAAEMLPPIVADAEAMTQVLVNLLSNALDASSPGSVIELAAQQSGQELVLSVTDQGAGIAPEDVDRIFHPFFTTKPVGQGTGLGLSICQGIVEQLGGRITLSSPGAQGSRFEIHLPLPEGPGGTES